MITMIPIRTVIIKACYFNNANMKFQLIEITFAMIDMNLDNHESNKSYEKKVDFCIDDSILVDGWIRMRRYDKEFKWW